MAAATQKVIEPEMEAQETTLVSPRFDEAAEQRARPVVPLAAESLPASPISTINRVARPTPLLSKKVSWLLAALIGLILTVGAATAIGVNRYRRNQAAAASSPVPTAEPIRVELKPDSIPVESRPVESRPVASGPVEPKRSTAPSSVPAIAVAKPKKVEQRAQQPVSDGKPKARMVDSYNPR